MTATAFIATYPMPDYNEFARRYDGLSKVLVDAWIKFGRELAAWRKARVPIPVEVRIAGEMADTFPPAPASWPCLRRSRVTQPRMILTFGPAERRSKEAS
jgi:hypothetical protein